MTAADRFEAAASALSKEFALICDWTGTVLWADARAARMLSIGPGSRFPDTAAVDSREKCERFLVDAARARTVTWELVFFCEGQPVLFECVGEPHDGNTLVVATRLSIEHAGSIAEMAAMLSELARLQREAQRQERTLVQRGLDLAAVNTTLARERRLLEAILTQLPSGVLVIDAATRQVIIANDQVNLILNVPRLVAILESLEHDVPAEPENELSFARLLWRTLVLGEAFSDEEISIDESGGSRRTVRVYAVAIRDEHQHVIAVAGVFHDVTNLKLLQDHFEHNSLHDMLTGLPNRRLFMTQLDRAIAAAARRGTDVALLFLDIDGFKEINDTWGHQVGDYVLSEVASRLNANVRAGDLAARLAGDEFTVLLDDVKGMDAATTIAQRMLNAFAESLMVDELPLHISLSIGVAISKRGETDGQHLLEQADLAMYRAKQHGKHQYRIYTAERSLAAG